MNWADDDLVWNNLDDLIMNSWNDLKNFLDALHEYNDELNLQMKGILFGGFGQFAQAYVVARGELNSPKHSMAIALEKTTQNPMFAALMQSAIHQSVDKAMTGGE